MSVAHERRVLKFGRAMWNRFAVYALGAICALGFEAWARNLEPSNPRLTWAVLNQLYANAALGVFVLTLIARPVAGFWPGLLRARRALGIITFCFAAIHTAYAFLSSFSGRFSTVLELSFERQIAFICGTTALLICLLLFVTSNNTAVRLMRKHWTTMQRLAVPAFTLALIHTLLAGNNFGIKPLHLSSALLLAVADLLFVVRALSSDRRRGVQAAIRARTQRVHATASD